MVVCRYSTHISMIARQYQSEIKTEEKYNIRNIKNSSRVQLKRRTISAMTQRTRINFDWENTNFMRPMERRKKIYINESIL